VTGFQIQIPLKTGTNIMSVVGVDIHGQPIAGTSNTVSIVYTGTLPSPVGQVVINEIMCNPSIDGAQYVELHNNSSGTTFDLSGWQFNGLAYTFPAGSIIPANGYLVLAANRAAFAAAYGASTPLFDTFGGVLQADGETLTLINPGASGGTNLVVSKVKY